MFIRNVAVTFIGMVLFTILSKPIYLYDELGHIRSHSTLYGFFTLLFACCVLFFWPNKTHSVSCLHTVPLRECCVETNRFI